MKILSSFGIMFFVLFLVACSEENKRTTDEVSKQNEVITASTNCYAKYNIQDDLKPRSTYILILFDQTTLISERLANHITEKIKPLVQPGTKFTFANFSTFSKDYYTSISHEFFLEPLPSEKQEQEVPLGKLKKIKKCIAEKQNYIHQELLIAMNKNLREANSTIDQSEIIKNLKDILQAKENDFQAKKSTVIIISDMLEHSSITSFYSNGTLREITPDSEFEKIKKLDFLANFHQSKVYIIGAGVVNDKNQKRLIKAMENLKKFWIKYFEASNAKLSGFGAPELIEVIVQ